MMNEKDKANWKEIEKLGYSLEDCICQNCEDKESCRFAWDIYNVHGECLAVK